MFPSKSLHDRLQKYDFYSIPVNENNELTKVSTIINVECKMKNIKVEILSFNHSQSLRITPYRLLITSWAFVMYYLCIRNQCWFRV